MLELTILNLFIFSFVAFVLGIISAGMTLRKKEKLNKSIFTVKKINYGNPLLSVYYIHLNGHQILGPHFCLNDAKKSIDNIKNGLDEKGNNIETAKDCEQF